MCPAKKFAIVILCNKTGASLPRLADKAAELVLGTPAAKGRPTREPATPSKEQIQNYAGTYTNGKTTLRLAVRDGALVGPAGAKLIGVGEHRFRRPVDAPGPETEMVFVPGPDGKIAYLVRGGRALKKTTGPVPRSSEGTLEESPATF
jgi:hypothetical protein